MANIGHYDKTPRAGNTFLPFKPLKKLLPTIFLLQNPKSSRHVLIPLKYLIENIFGRQHFKINFGAPVDDGDDDDDDGDSDDDT